MAENMVIASDLKEAKRAEDALISQVQLHGYSEVSTFAIKLALEEGLTNAVRHGNRFDPNKQIHVTFDINSDQVVITITDQGDGFDPETVPDPTLDENLEKPAGRGIMLMMAYMDEVNYSKQGKQLRLVKRND